jgi:hypothetical protein
MRIRVHDGRLDRAALGRAVLQHCPYALLPLDARELLTFDTTAWPWSTAPEHHDLTIAHRFL